uniref:DnaJ homolog subfamily C member 9-like n=1 Tax=Dermatophagoides pteronyssinus TaxID=6956 RepID=A0A6P6YIW7_DERPT|nr:dnaJ homolog subfamily C member 9-like [Dermatophagoides pteronyssinus]
MEFLQECQDYFGTKNLYEILDLSKTAKLSEIKSAYRKKSLKVHPDRVQIESQKESAKRAFQILTKVHCVLSNDEYRKVYDESGMIITDENSFTNLSTFEEFLNYWRTLFPRIDSKKLENFAQEYIGSSEEEKDLKNLYLKFNGDLNMIFEHHYFYDEDRVTEMLNKLIDSNEIPKFDAFVKESKSKKEKRLKKIKKEASLAEKEAKKKDDDNSDLIMAIQKRNSSKENNFDDMIKNLEAKYAGSKNQKSSTKNKKRRV